MRLSLCCSAGCELPCTSFAKVIQKHRKKCRISSASGIMRSLACSKRATMRLEFSKQTKREAWLRADGHCEGCGQKFGERRPDYDHQIPAAFGGDNSLGNCKCLCPKCHRAKTSFDDMPAIRSEEHTSELQSLRQLVCRLLLE